MKNKQAEWKKAFKDEFGIHFGESELQFALTFIENLLCQQEEFWELKLEEKNKMIDKLILDEISIAQKEGQPTSRLTSLAVKLEEQVLKNAKAFQL